MEQHSVCRQNFQPFQLRMIVFLVHYVYESYFIYMSNEAENVPQCLLTFNLPHKLFFA